ncbi:hypothetical protein MPTK1_5g17790 [Marchantia polymorpha subsp. ruderalis]|uniref:Uncharacterized protein n=2 Tax=Marchantia polymorpha TaxID=3197 RepID=A0AAF6BJG6_MARPO|nr:hypothetical protein MARPO_0084s0029 [Marchantia polymorpha]BBN12150.1 hypothetical protein Mp_5g17790 [Marchantia polymorpha subsp. ruderalis]|eukprot:PTQ33939.1 hypothetical protein MARPO_0084s0029 [Marchantia polymorpha]
MAGQANWRRWRSAGTANGVVRDWAALGSTRHGAGLRCRLLSFIRNNCRSLALYSVYLLALANMLQIVAGDPLHQCSPITLSPTIHCIACGSAQLNSAPHLHTV